MLSSVEHEKSFMTSGPDQMLHSLVSDQCLVCTFC